MARDTNNSHGKELSYNNIVDMEAAWNMVWEFTDPLDMYH